MNDVETRAETSPKVHKLPTEPQRQKTLSQEIEEIWESCAKNICSELHKKGIELKDLLGEKHYL